MGYLVKVVTGTGWGTQGRMWWEKMMQKLCVRSLQRRNIWTLCTGCTDLDTGGVASPSTTEVG